MAEEKGARSERRHEGLRVLRCWASKPSTHEPHSFAIKDERYWCPGYVRPIPPASTGGER